MRNFWQKNKSHGKTSGAPAIKVYNNLRFSFINIPQLKYIIGNRILLFKIFSKIALTYFEKNGSSGRENFAEHIFKQTLFFNLLLEVSI